jgi:antitoxin ParD1/3/4
MNVSLTPELEKLVQTKLDSGMYHSASEVVRDSLRLLKERDDLKEAQLARLRDDVDIGLAQLEAGNSKPLDAGLREAIKARARARHAVERGSK